jgi:hypothetical protein
MPVVRNVKSRAKDFYDGGRRGRGRRAKFVCSCFVLAANLWLGASWADVGEVRFGVILLATALPTVNGPEHSVSRDSEAAAKRTDPALASITRCWRHVFRA